MRFRESWLKLLHANLSGFFAYRTLVRMPCNGPWGSLVVQHGSVSLVSRRGVSGVLASRNYLCRSKFTQPALPIKHVLFLSGEPVKIDLNHSETLSQLRKRMAVFLCVKESQIKFSTADGSILEDVVLLEVTDEGEALTLVVGEGSLREDVEQHFAMLSSCGTNVFSECNSDHASDICDGSVCSFDSLDQWVSTQFLESPSSGTADSLDQSDSLHSDCRPGAVDSLDSCPSGHPYSAGM